MNANRHPPLLIVWALLLVVGLGWGLGTAPLGDQDEGRNGEVAREMAASDDYVLPHLNGLPYIDKPVLSFAATAAVMEILGPTELAARSVPFVCSLITALLVGVCAGRWFGREAGWVAGIVAMTAPLPLAFSRIVILDALLALLVTSSLLAFLAAIEARADRRPDRVWTLLAWAAIGLGILTKGPVALAVPLMVAAPYALWRRASWAVWNPLGPLLAAAIVTPWVWFMEDRLPGYLRYVAITETWQRVSSDELRRTQPWWYFLVIGGVGFFPWWPLAIGRGRSTGDRHPRRVFALLWLAIPLVFFSLSRSKLPQYILPLMPAVALLVASRWSTLHDLPRRSTAVSLVGWSILALVMAAAGLGALEQTRIQPELLAALPAPAGLMAVVCLLSVGWAVVALRSGRGSWLVAALSLPMVALPVVLQPVITAAAERRSERALADLIRSELPAEAEVVGYRVWRPSLSFYLRRPVPILSRDGAELRSNYILRTHDRWSDPAGWLRPIPPNLNVITSCDQPRVILVHARRPDHQALMDGAGLEKIWTGPKLHAYYCDPLESTADPVPPPGPVDQG
ncbi:MAG: glycosyltransferase family 39 protein [Candidatus Sulfomarinibacteraceae bacterium]